MVIHGVNGINSDGSQSTDLILRELSYAGFTVNDVNQPRRNFISVRWRAEEDADYIVDTAIHGDVVVAHSYGGLKALLAARKIEFSHMFLFAPACSKHWEFKGKTPADRVTCIYTPHDRMIWLGSRLLFHPFGEAGLSGFTHPDVTNVEDHRSKRHSDFFKGTALQFWAAYIARRIREKECVTA